MSAVRLLIALFVLLTGALVPAPASASDSARDAVIRALPLIQRSAATFVDKRACFSCHHNGLSIMTLRLADRHGIAVFPGADHGLFVGDFDPDRPRAEQLAPGFLPMVTEFLRAA